MSKVKFLALMLACIGMCIVFGVLGDLLGYRITSTLLGEGFVAKVVYQCLFLLLGMIIIIVWDYE